MANDVADNENKPTAEGYRIEPVPARRGVLRGDEIVGADLGSGYDGYRSGEQRLLHHDGGIADVAIPLGQLLHARPGGRSRLHALRHVIEDDLHPLDRAVGPTARRDEKVEVPLLES